MFDRCHAIVERRHRSALSGVEQRDVGGSAAALPLPAARVCPPRESCCRACLAARRCCRAARWSARWSPTGYVHPARSTVSPAGPQHGRRAAHHPSWAAQRRLAGWGPLAGASLIAEQVPGRSRWLRWKVTRPRRRVTAPGSDHRSVRPVIGRTARCAAVVVVAASPSVATHEAGPSCNVPSFFTETIVVYRGGMPGGTCSGDRTSHSRCGRGTSGSAVREPDGGDANQFSAVRWKLLDRQTVAHVGREALGQPVNRGRRQKVYADRELPVLRLGDRVANSNLGGPGPSRVRDDGWTEVPPSRTLHPGQEVRFVTDRQVAGCLGATDVSVGGSHDHDVVRSRCFDLRIQPGCDRLSRSAVSSVVPRVVEGRPLPARNAARRGRGGSQVQGGACAIA